MHRAIEETERLFAFIGQTLYPGITEREVADVVHAAIAHASLGPAWYAEICPGVKFGPETAFGHGIPGDIALEAGFVVSVDLGVRFQGYCSDLQRVWYVRQAGERQPPAVVQRAFDAVKGAIDAARAVLRPGVAGWQVDAAAREYLTRAGYPEFQHALGHGVGRQVHDSGPLLGPQIARYGERPYAQIEEGMVLTLDVGIETERGYVSQEDEVLVTVNGSEWISHPQESLYLV